MRLKSRFLGTCLLLAAVASAPDRAAACSTEVPEPGLLVWEIGNPPDRLFTATGGVFSLYGVLYDVEPADAAALVDVALTLDGEALATEVEVLRLSPTLVGAQPAWTVAIVVRPLEPLQAGDYQVAVGNVDGDETTFPLTVEAEPVAMPEPPTAAVIQPEEVTAGYDGQVCCESRQTSSCGDTERCTFTLVSKVPAVHVSPSPLPRAQAGSALVWVQRLDAAGQPDPDGRFSYPARNNISWTVEFAAAQAEYCVVLGVTYLVDGTSVSGSPQCLTREEAGEPHVVTQEPSDEEIESWECVGPLEYDDGTPFGEEPPAEKSGCRLDGDGVSWAWMVVLAGLGLRRRRR
ncbi:MYXO-CTERM sorting domain-containing protein [Nannocystis pusilla]|uniref:MYXO-CTERM sorting domain-containing protein n=1 Tax=Nannocystis pusilla TaxID=889268 RepID=UPI003DA4A7D0